MTNGNNNNNNNKEDEGREQQQQHDNHQQQETTTSKAKLHHDEKYYYNKDGSYNRHSKFDTKVKVVPVEIESPSEQYELVTNTLLEYVGCSFEE